jgi:carboxyl-terminal processing protease
LVAHYQNLRKQIPEPKPHQVAVPLNEGMSVAYDPHMQYRPQFRYNGLNHVRQKPGIGMAMVPRGEQGVEVVQVFVNSEAERVGLKSGDHITHIAGRRLALNSFNQVDAAFDFENEQVVPLKVQRGAKTFHVHAKFSYGGISPIVERVFERGGRSVGYLSMAEIPDNFDPETECRIVAERILRPFESSTSALILDLRHNYGGPGETAACLAGLFLGKDSPIYIEQSIEGLLTRTVRSEVEQAYSKPVVVLVNARTMSSGELLAGALQFHGRALLVGDRTYGKAIGQTVEPYTPLRVDLYYTLAKAYLPDGKSYHAQGLVPDVRVFE